MQDLGERAKALAERTTLIRGRGAYGRKPHYASLLRLAEWGPISIHHYDDTTGTTVMQTLQDVEPIVKANRARMLSGHDGYTPSRDLQLVGRVPLDVAAELFKKGINFTDPADAPKIAAKLDSPEWAAWRTAPGTVSKRPYREYFVPPRRR